LRLQDKLRQQSMRDPLTQLFNRRYLQETLEREISRARRNKQEMCCLVIDIDHFKKFNDTYGHDGGDALLVNFAKMLAQNVRNEDIVCRYGGEEFVVILPGTNAEGGMARANILRTLASEMTVVIDKKTVANITFSAGMSVFPQHGDTRKT
jgi:diguanylate cyclase (GGDEF)-like protein